MMPGLSLGQALANAEGEERRMAEKEGERGREQRKQSEASGWSEGPHPHPHRLVCAFWYPWDQV